MSDLRELAERVETATAEQQREMLEATFRAIHGEKPQRVHGGSQDLTDWLNLHNPFVRMLEAQAYESAAMTLVPEGWTWVVDSTGRASCFKPNEPKPWPRAAGMAATPALALCAVALRAREEDRG